MNPHGGIERRQYVRVQYPAFDRPLFRASQWTAHIHDVSQGGARLEVASWPTGDVVIASGAVLDGALELEGDVPIPVHGRVVRFDGTFIAMQFLEPLLPPDVISAQQRRLSAKYPTGW